MSTIKTFGPVDERSLKQLERCMEAGDAEFGVLCADHHPGYSQPIGGGIAYEGYVSPSGVGYDIGCIAASARVSTNAGFTRPIEHVGAEDPILCVDGGRVRAADPHFGSVARGFKRVVELRLDNDRRLRLTSDHLVRTSSGWREVGGLSAADEVVCLPTIGYEHEAYGLTPVWIRLLAYVSGDGHLARDGKRVSVYTSVEEDAAALVRDLSALGYEPRLRRRMRDVRRRPEIHVYVDSRRLHRELAGLGSPVGKKLWPALPMRWLLQAPDWVRAHFLSAFASAEMSTPRLVGGCVTNLAVKQADANAARLVVELLTSLGFTASLARSATQWLVQVLGGEAEQVRFIEQVGFCLAAEKRIAAARALSVSWQRCAILRHREAARTAVEALYAAGEPYRGIVEAVAADYRIPRGFVHHALYDDRPLRRGLGVVMLPRVEGESVLVPVQEVREADTAPVWDVVTGDPAQSFVAEGIVVHNCGNKAARTELTRADLDELGGVDSIMREITRRISFGMGVPAQERVDHPVLDRIRNAAFSPQRKLVQLAQSQLGTVGSGNHYVNLMEDEEDRIWVGVHFGSRGFGHKTASGFLSLAAGGRFDERGKEGEMESPPDVLDVSGELGQAYLSAMELAGAYAHAGREVVVRQVLGILGAQSVGEPVHNHHNYAWLEHHDGEDLYVIRKGATPAFPGQQGFVGATMGEPAVILEGVDSEVSEAALFSTVHGAGRAMSRTAAAGKQRKRWACDNRDCGWSQGQGEHKPDDGACPRCGHPSLSKRMVRMTEGAIDWDQARRDLIGRGIELRGAAADEAPGAYKRLAEVLAAHEGTVRILHTLRPLGVAMAGPDTPDPWKD